MLDFELQDVMRLSNIKRWSIVEISRPQSVAEHSYNVAMIALSIAEKNGYGIDFGELLEWALTHDLTELVTGDVPTPHKSKLLRPEAEEEMFPKFASEKAGTSQEVREIVKVADLLDAYQFADKFMVDSRRVGILITMMERLLEAINKMGDNWAKVACDVCGGLLNRSLTAERMAMLLREREKLIGTRHL